MVESRWTVSFPLKRVVKYATKVGCYLNQFSGQPIPPDKLAPIARIISKLIPKTSEEIIVQSITDLCKPKLMMDEKLARRTAWRLAANFETLQNRIPCGVPTGEVSEHHAVAIISVVAATQSAKNKPQLKIGFRIWSGPYAGQLICYSFPYKYSSILYKQAASRPRKTKFLSPLLLSGFKCQVKIGWYREQPKIAEIHFSPSQHSYNTGLLRAKFRQLSVCPLGKKVDCFRCPLGRDTCPNAVRPKTYDIEIAIQPQRATRSIVQQGNDDSSGKRPAATPMVFS